MVVKVQQCSLLHGYGIPAKRHFLTDIIGYRADSWVMGQMGQEIWMVHVGYGTR